MGEDRRPSLWKTLKRALTGAAPGERATVVPPAPPPQTFPDVDATPPFLGEIEPAVSAAKEGEASDPQAARLARGLASFSRRNPEREKKFAHLLHDAPSDEKKGTTPPGRRG